MLLTWPGAPHAAGLTSPPRAGVPPSDSVPGRGVPSTVLALIQFPSSCLSSANRCRFLPSITRTVSTISEAPALSSRSPTCAVPVVPHARTFRASRPTGGKSRS